MANEPIRAQEEELSQYTLEGVIKYLKGIQAISGKSISKVREAQNMDIEALRLLKDTVSPYAEGDRVICRWGSSDFSQIGTVVDPFVMYNSYMEWSRKSEFGCNIRFDNLELPTGYKLDRNAIVPWREIKPIDVSNLGQWFFKAADRVNKLLYAKIEILSIDFLNPNDILVNVKANDEKSVEIFKKEADQYYVKNRKYTIRVID